MSANQSTSKELEERAREWFADNIEYWDGNPNAREELTALLTRIRDEARLEEAKWWNARHHDPTRLAAQSRHERLESLARAVSKETER